MNAWRLFILLCAWTITQSTNYLIQPYTYYFQIHDYPFEFDMNDELDVTANAIYIDHKDIHINILFHTNTSSYIFNLDHNVSLDYDYDPDWTVIQTLMLPSPPHITGNDLIHIDTTTNASHDFHRRRLYQRARKKGKYIGVSHARNFHDAERVCRHRYGGELASARSSSENTQIQKLCRSLSRRSNCWIGMRRPFRHWTNGKRVSYKHWQPGEPNNAGRHESCTEIYRSGRWNDNRCKRTRPFICETARTSRDRSYIAVGMALSWDNANEYCHRRFNTELATVRSSSTNRAVRRVCNRVANKGSCWIGLERPFKKWQDKKRVSYKRWNPGEPNNAGKSESCTEMYSNKKWNDLPCRRGRFFVCNYKGVDNRSGRRGRRRRKGKRRRRRRRRRRSGGRWVRGRRKHRKVKKEAKGKTLHMECSRGRIEISKASYGRNCKSNLYNNQLRTLRRKCNGKSRCRYKIRGIKDPARGCAKEYDYTYRCKWRKGRHGKKRRRRRRSRRRRNRMRRWKCSRLRFDDYERKECLRRRAGTLRKGGRSRSTRRRRWRKRLERWATMMKQRGYKGFSGMGRGFRRGYEAGKRSVSRGMGNAMSNIRSGGGGGGAVNGGLGPLPRIRMKRFSSSGVPLPPRIQLIDLPPGGGGGYSRGRRRRRSRRRSRRRRRFSRRLGTGYGLGMMRQGRPRMGSSAMGQQLFQKAADQGASKKDLQMMKALTQLGYEKAEKDDTKKLEEKLGTQGFGGFRGFDGFGSGRLLETRGNRKRNRNGMNTEGLSFGIGENVRRRLEDVEELDALGYDEKKCVQYGVYEICVGYGVVQVKEFVSVTMNVEESKKKKKSMDEAPVYVEVYEFVYDNMNECWSYLEPFVICLYMNDAQETIVAVQKEESEYSFNYSNDRQWSQINQMIGSNHLMSVQKCVDFLDMKMCIDGENNTKFKLIVYKTA
eukprot:220246_1